MPVGEAIEDYPLEPQKKGNASKAIAFLILIAAIGGYIYLKKRKK